jgi:hypothetical protein
MDTMYRKLVVVATRAGCLLYRLVSLALLRDSEGDERNFSHKFSQLHRACCFDYFFNIPTHAPTIYTLKSTKFTFLNILV